MKTIKELSEWQAFRSSWPADDVGFVPTMGALHQGHTSLVDRSLAENRHTVVSIFVNPAQFDAGHDLDAYPATPDDDLALLEKQGVDAVLMPGARDMYPDGYRYRVTEEKLSGRWCGVHRSGHFDGVLTVVMKLLQLVRPTRAYFGEKDFQQLLLVRGMVDAFFLPVEVVACPTVREPDGLAMSSRNRHLDAQQRRLAPEFTRSLRQAPDPEGARALLEAAGFEVDYVEDFEARRLGAVRLGDVRLIDNVTLGSDQA